LFRSGTLTKKKIIEDEENHAALLQLSKKDNKKRSISFDKSVLDYIFA
jgi:hypothetical protein